MKKNIFMDKYPLNSMELQKNEISQNSVNEIVEFFKAKIDSHPIATFISVFDHYAHTTALNGDINPEIKDAKNVVFCFGAALPNTKMLAVRPRSIGVAELEDRFIIEFMDAPKEDLNAVMIAWCKDLKN